MAKPILVANWKNHPETSIQAKVLMRKLAKNSRGYRRLSVFIAPPLPYLELVGSRLGTFANLASQDMPLVSQGTHTGVVTPDILKGFGTRLAIIGHSELRALGESDEIVAKKIKVALKAGITPLVCVGETVRDPDGEHFEFLRNQMRSSLAGIKRKSDISKLMVAYEPVWAIGKTAKDAIKTEDLSQTIIFIRKTLSDIFGRSNAEHVPILYGGSVESGDAEALFSGSDIKGFLVGHASLDAKDFKIIAETLISK